MRTIAIVSQKGGTGKTTTALNIGAGLTRLGKRVLLIDTDAQAHLTYGIGIKAPELSKTVYELLQGAAEPAELMVERDGVKVIPASLTLSGAEAELGKAPGREFLLREALNRGNTSRAFDYALIDTPPSLGLLTLCALVSASEAYAVLQAEFLALQGVSTLMRTVDTIRERLNPRLSITGVIVTRFDGRKRLNNEVAERIRAHFKEKVFKTRIRDNVSLAEAPSFGQTIFEYKPHSYGAEDYLNLSREILKRG